MNGAALMLRCILVGLSLLLAAPAVAQKSKVPRIGLLAVSPPALEFRQAQLRDALRELGYTEGRNIVVEYRGVNAGETSRLDALAAELVSLKVDAIIAIATPSVQAAKRATSGIPIIMAAGDPVGTGLVASLARPGGNVTGISLTSAELGAKHLELLRELRPALTRVGLLVHATDPFATPFREQVEGAARRAGLKVSPFVVRGAEEFDAAFRAMAKERVDAVLVQPILATKPAADLATQYGIPSIAGTTAYSGAGGLMSYSPSAADFYGRLVRYIDRILKGAKPADLPVEQPTRFELVINKKAAQSLRIELPRTLVLQADRVVE